MFHDSGYHKRDIVIRGSEMSSGWLSPWHEPGSCSGGAPALPLLSLLVLFKQFIRAIVPT